MKYARAGWRHRGVTMIVTLIFLMLASLLGIAAITSTKWQILMARNAQQKTTSFARSENARVAAENRVQQLSRAAFPSGQGLYDSTINAPPDVTNKEFWQVSANFVAVGATSGYVIEHLGYKSITLDDRTTSGESHVYRLTTHGVGDDGTTETIAQCLYLED
jgi:Tfp pilus assembly protein PilX